MLFIPSLLAFRSIYFGKIGVGTGRDVLVDSIFLEIFHSSLPRPVAYVRRFKYLYSIMMSQNITFSIVCLIIITVLIISSQTGLNTRFAARESLYALVNYEQPKHMAGLSIPKELFVPPRTWSTTGGLQFDAKPNISFPITSNKAAQFYINRGLTTLYAFNQNDACTLFLRAAATDPTCGFAYAAAAYAINMNINHVAINEIAYLNFHWPHFKRHIL